MKKFALFLVLLMFPAAASGLEQSFTQQGLKATVKLSPEKLEKDVKVQLTVRLEQNDTAVTDRNVQLAVYEKDASQPIFTRSVDHLDSEYLDSWKFDESGDYRIVIKIVNQQKSDEGMQYEVMASVPDAGHEQGFFAHHFSGKGKWGWWGTGLMIIMMVPMVALML